MTVKIKNMQAFIRTIFIICMSLAFISACTKTEVATEAKKEDAQSAAIAEVKVAEEVFKAEVVFLQGDVKALRGSETIKLDIGSEILKDDTVKTGKNGAVDIKFGKTAVTRLQPNTEVSIKALSLKASAATVDLKLAAGSVLSKVEKLAGKDNYGVRSETAVCGVRGTEFLVALDPIKGTKIAVKQGKVAVLPASAALDRLAVDSKTNAVAEAAVLAVSAQAIEVGVGEETSITQADADKASIVFAALEEEVKALPVIEKVVVSGTENDVVLFTVAPELVETKAEEATSALTMGGETVGDNTALAKKAETTESAQAVPVIVLSDDIRTKLNNAVNVSFKKPMSEKKKFTKESDNAFKAIEILAPMRLPSEIDAESLKNKDAKAEDDAKALEAKEAEAKAAEAKALEEKATLAKAEEEKTKALALAEKTKAEAEAKPILGNFPITKTRVVGSLVQAQGLVLASDAQGNVGAVRADGTRAWLVKTSNSGNENSFPVVFKSNVYFSGASEFLIIKAETGAILKRIPLEDEKVHAFGNRVAQAANGIIYPTSNGLEILDPETGALVRSIEVPDGTMMTPAFFEGKAVIVNQKGLLLTYDVQSGSEIARVQTKGLQPTALAPRIYNGKACFADRKGLVVMVDLKTMATLWEKKIPDNVFTDLEFGKEGIFVFAKNSVYAFKSDGTEIGKPFPNVSAPPLLSSGKLYYGTKDGFLMIRDAQTLAVEKSLELKEVISARPLFVDGVLYLATQAGNLIKINPTKIK